MKKENNNNILYGIIGVLALIIVAGLGYFLGQNGNSNSVSTKSTPMVIEAGKLGLDEGKINKCIAENKYISKINSQMKFGADKFGITGTPGNVLINNETGEYVVISGAYPKESFIENIDNLLSDSNTTGEEVKSDKIFKEITDNDNIIIITDKKDKTPIDQIIEGLKKINEVKDMKITKYDFSDIGTKEYLEKNNIKFLPAVIFTKGDINKDINKHLIKLNDNAYSLNIGATFTPFKQFVSKETMEQIKKDSYIDGKEGAKITWLEYSDLECPYCQKLHNSDVEATLKEKYGSDLNIIFNHFPLGFHKKAIPGANILECVGEQGGSEAFYKILKYAFKNKIQE